MARPGWWRISSKSDSRWNVQGEASFVGMGIESQNLPEIVEALKELKEKFGKPPDDTYVEYSKQPFEEVTGEKAG